jgi:probable O-glycosylation ligase (exosortase A-associated)
MPEQWHARIDSIGNYEEDPSSQGRLAAWRHALEVAHDSPVVGGGFDVVRATGRDVHSIYFEALAEHGYVGLVIFLALGIGAYLTAGSTIRRARDHPELAWAVDLAAMVQVSIAAYAIAGAFLTLATFDLYYHLIAIVVVASALVRARLAAGVPVGAATPTPAHAQPADLRA